MGLAQDGGQVCEPAKTYARTSCGINDLVVRVALDKTSECDLPLKPCQTHTDAGMGSASKGEMAIRLATDVKLFRCLEL